MFNNMTFKDYKDYSNEEKELHNFEMTHRILSSLQDLKETNAKEHKELKDHALRTNGRVNKLELWRSMTVGAFILLGILLPYLTLAN